MKKTKRKPRPPSRTFAVGDRVSWNSEAGRVRGVIVKKVVSDTAYKGYVHHATREDPQYLIASDKTDHVAIHKGKALRRLGARKAHGGQQNRAVPAPLARETRRNR